MNAPDYLCENKKIEVDDLIDLQKRVRNMKPHACGHEHENRIVQMRENGQINKHVVTELPFFSDEHRVNNPACAHCFLFDSMRDKIRKVYPSLETSIATYTDDRRTALLPNPFAVEFMKAITLGVHFTNEELCTLFEQAEEILEKREFHVLKYEDSRFKNLLTDLIRKLGNFSVNSFEKKSIETLIEKKYMNALRSAIITLDGMATEDARNKTYDYETMTKYQNVILELLEVFQKLLLVAIDRRIAELHKELDTDS
jgi:hypothetical protein